jgi:hypothetical protein
MQNNYEKSKLKYVIARRASARPGNLHPNEWFYSLSRFRLTGDTGTGQVLLATGTLRGSQ